MTKYYIVTEILVECSPFPHFKTSQMSQHNNPPILLPDRVSDISKNGHPAYETSATRAKLALVCCKDAWWPHLCPPMSC